MTVTSSLQILLAPTTDDGVLSVVFKERSHQEEIPRFKSAIEGRLHSDSQIRRVRFDLSKIDPIINVAGRLLDLACEISKKWKKPVEARVPADIYELLYEIEPHRVPPPTSKLPLQIRGVTVQLVEPLSDLVENRAEAAPEGGGTTGAVTEAESKTILYCRGKIRAVNGSVVSVTLFTKEEKIDGEFDRSQFSRTDLTPGMMFEYKARTKPPGLTTVSIDLLTPQYPSDDEILDASKALTIDFSKF